MYIHVYSQKKTSNMKRQYIEFLKRVIKRLPFYIAEWRPVFSGYKFVPLVTNGP